MSKLKKLASVMLALVMVFAMSVTAFAADSTYSITINKAADGETYNAYKVFDATYTEVTDDEGNTTTLTSYTIEKDSTFYSAVESSGLFTLTQVGDSDTYVVELKDSETTGAAIRTALSSVVLTDVIADGTAIAADGSATISLTAAGYYYVTTTLGSVVALDSANPTATIDEKNGTPSVDKEETTDGTAGIGDKVEYKSTIKDAANIANLVYHDVMSEGLTFNNDVSIEGMTEGTDYNVVTEGLTDGCTFEVVFTETGMAKITGDVVITYSATVNEDAVIDGKGNPNDAYVSYGNAGESTHDETITYVYDFDLSKTTSDGTALSGAEFTLADADGNLISFVKETAEDGSVSYRVATKEDTDTTTTIEAGSVNIYGLDAGTYTLTETKAPDGYNQLSDSLTVTINEDGTVTFDGSTVTVVKVVNESGSELPSTGGIGTTIFYIVGGVLVLGAAVLLITRKRMGKAE